MASLAVLGLLVAASPAAAIVITGGPTYAPGAGWTCTAPAAGLEKRAGGGNYSCSGTASAFSNLYIGINTATAFPFGEKMNATSAADQPTGVERFVWSANGATFIRYTGQTTYNGVATFTRVTLTFTGSGTVVDDATTQAMTGANINGSIHALWRIGSGVSSMSVNVLIEASTSAGGTFTPVDGGGSWYGTTTLHRGGTASTLLDNSHVDLAFYTSTCGDSNTDTVIGTDGSAEQCDLGGANGAATSCCTSACLFRAGGQVCRTSAGVCDVQETCSGSSATCPADLFLTTQCRASAGVCDPAENCTGSAATCPNDTFSSSATVCRPNAGVCDVAENCTGSTAACPGDALASSATVCRPTAGACDTAENCTGSSVSCPADDFQSSATVCRASAGVCDVAENCTGSTAACPTDAFEPSTQECRASGGVCDPAENCTGSAAACPGDTFSSSATVCRGSAGVCDVAENCTGSTAACPGDALASSATVCRPTAGACDTAENCTGSSVSCPANDFQSSATVCRASAGVCDVAENCTGSTADCPTDAFEPSTQECRASAGVCDIAEDCTGSTAACPADAKSTAVCRPVADVCDVAESCNGTDDDCPTDSFESSSTVCRPTAGVCDVAENCTGSGSACPSDDFVTAGSNTVCRPINGICDVAEECDGTGVNCPTDDYEPSTTMCRPGNGVCDTSESCTGTGPNCPADSFQSSSVVCRPSSGVCDTTENCTGGTADCPSDAVEPPTTVCRPAASTADAPESCDGSTKFCPADAFLPAGTPCDDGSFCTFDDEADGNGNCNGQPVDCDDVNPCTDDSCDSQGGGFLCVNENNGDCIGPNCGNFVVDEGETCDPPNLALDPVTGQTECRLDCTSCGDGVVQANNTETCDDGNTISGCRTDQPQRELDSCLNNCTEPICADPAKISFGRAPKLDVFQFHGRLISGLEVDFVDRHFVIELRSATGEVIYRSSLVRGSLLQQNEKSVRYKNRDARFNGGVYQLKAKRGVDYYGLTIKTYGDLSASVADMTTHVYSGTDEWVVRGLWTAQGTKGWKLSNKATFLPVP